MGPQLRAPHSRTEPLPLSEAEHKTICKNRRARFQYEIDETIEAGLVLQGSEVKSMREGKANLSDSYGRIKGGEAFLVKAHIEPYKQATHRNHEPERERKLLLNRREIHRLGGKLRERGFTLVPIEMYFKGGRAKVLLGLGRGKKLYDKRRTIAKRESDKRLQRLTKRKAQRR
ncbi:MAG: SsrA-binding protein SmpB [bacterium]|nr:SsrA-binding protein SmpB [bacterium]